MVHTNNISFDDDDYVVGRDFVEFDQKQIEGLHGVRKSLKTKLHNCTITVEDVNNASAAIESIGIPESFIMDHTFGNGRYPLLDETYDLLFRAVYILGSVNEGLSKIYNRLARALRQLMQYKRTGVYLSDDITRIQNSLRVVDQYCQPGGVISTPEVEQGRLPGDPIVPEGQAILSNLIHKTHKIAHWLLVQSEVDPALENTQKKLILIKQKVDTFIGRSKAEHADPLTAFRSLGGPSRGVTLNQIQQVQAELASIERTRQNGMFVAEDGSIPKGQGALANMMEYLYDRVHDLLTSEEAEKHRLHPEFSALYQELVTMDNELVKMQGSAYTLPELEVRPFQQRLREIETTRTRDRKFVVQGEDTILPGQAILFRLMSRCYERVHAILVATEDQLPTDPDADHQLDVYAWYKSLMDIRKRLKDLKVADKVALKDIVSFEEPLEALATEILDDERSRANNALRCLVHETYNLLFEVIMDRDL